MQSQTGKDKAGIFFEMLQPYPRLAIAQGDMAAYKVLRHREPALVSITDGDHGLEQNALDALVLQHNDEPVGAVSYLVQTNKIKEPGRNQFARIDLVITDARFRELGVGRALLMCVIYHLLHHWQDKLYSISCLAAHEAIRKTLEGIGFAGQVKEGLNYVHEEMKLDQRLAAALLQEMPRRAAAALKIVNYNFRQQEGAS